MATALLGAGVGVGAGLFSSLDFEGPSGIPAGENV